MFNRLPAFWPKGYQSEGSLGKSQQNGDCLNLKTSNAKKLSSLRIRSYSFWITAVPSLRGAREGRAPPNDRLYPPILVYSEYFFGASRNDKTTGNNRKRSNYVQKFSFEIFSILCKIAGYQLLYINVTQ